MVTVLFPGRHHVLTKFQYVSLKQLIDNGYKGKKIDRIIFAITSANHSNTRRNPVPLYLRALAIEKFSRELPCEIKIYPIPDVKQTDKFAKYIISQIFYQGGENLNPKDTIVACSTPPIVKLFKSLGFDNFAMELIKGKKESYSTLRPYEVIDLIVKSGNGWRDDQIWKSYASHATQEVYLEYSLGDLINELFSDSLLTEDADITETRDYNTYSKGLDQNVQFKFNDIRPFITEGKIVDAGCGTGALVNLLSKNFPESDIIGIEATRKFYEFCKLQDYPNPFVYFYRRNLLDQNFKENTIDTFIYSSVLHEIYSYIGKAALIKMLKSTYKQLTPGGRIVIRDVIGPINKKQLVYLELNDSDGKDKGEIKELSTYTKFLSFTKDFIPRKISYKEVKINGKKMICLTLQDAYEFMSKMNYTDNWYSEVHEEFGFWSIEDWKTELKKIGFEIVEGSHTFKSDYIIEKMYKGKAKIYKKEGQSLIAQDYPPTNIILAAQKPSIH